MRPHTFFCLTLAALLTACSTPRSTAHIEVVMLPDVEPEKGPKPTFDQLLTVQRPRSHVGALPVGCEVQHHGTELKKSATGTVTVAASKTPLTVACAFPEFVRGEDFFGTAVMTRVRATTHEPNLAPRPSND